MFFCGFELPTLSRHPLELCNQIIGVFQVGVSSKPTNPKPILNTPRIQSWWTYHIGWSIQAPAWRNRQLLRWWRLLITMPRWERSISLERISTWMYLGSCVLKRGWLILARLWFPREKVHQWMIYSCCTIHLLFDKCTSHLGWLGHLHHARSSLESSSQPAWPNYWGVSSHSDGIYTNLPVEKNKGILNRSDVLVSLLEVPRE